MKIVFLGRYNRTETLSGPEKVAKRVFNELANTNNEVIFIEYFFKCHDCSGLYNRLVGKEIINCSPKVIRLGIFRLFFFLIKQQPDIIHVITFERFILTVFIYKFLLRGKIIYTVHGVIKYELKRIEKKRTLFSKIKDLFLEKLLLIYSDSLAFLSDIEVFFLKSEYNLKECKIKVIPNGVDEQFQFTEKKFSDKLNVVFYNGWGINVKGFDIFYNAVLDFIVEEKINVFILGNKPVLINYYSHIEKFIFVPSLNSIQLVQFLQDKHIYINSSEYEPFSLFAAECLASGLIIIISNRAGISEYIIDKTDGFIYDFNYPAELKEVLHEIVEGKYNLEGISSNASQISNKLNWENTGNKYIELYKNIL